MPVEKVVEKVVYVDRPVEKVGLSLFGLGSAIRHNIMGRWGMHGACSGIQIQIGSSSVAQG